MSDKEPPGSREPVVRRAVPLPGAAGTPEPDELRAKGEEPSRPVGAATTGGDPAAPPEPPESFAPASDTSSGAPESRPVSSSGPAAGEPDAPEAETSPGPDAASGAAGPEGSASPEPERESGNGPENGGEANPAADPASSASDSSSETAADPAAVRAPTATTTEGSAASAASGPPSGGATGLTAVATSGGNPPSASTATDAAGDPPSGKPTKALRAAAAIGGVLLIAVPLMALGANDDDDEKKNAAADSGVTLPGDADEDAPGSYQGRSPSPKAEKDKKDKEEKKEDKDEDEASGSDTDAESASDEKKDEKDSDEDSDKDEKKTSSLYRAHGPGLFKKKQIRNVMTGQCADISGFGKGKSGGKLMQFPCARDRSSDNQVWDFVVKQKGKGPGGRNLYVIKNVKDDLCLDLPGEGAVPGATGVVQYKCVKNADDNQRWWLQGRGNGKYWIRNYKSRNMCLDVWGKTFGAGKDAARLGVANCYPKDDHEWRFT
ncbi:RICIN domain-containing protein [Streptomyces sp. AA1529]|uniref:RICIN domain-containing protein n=1 Tax=Streptomyces sp. AA1529 TaxID=1203257 RepID=UPI00035DE10D|nr:RICIN domain-containing protein [Streptomyces sp. AA1529]